MTNSATKPRKRFKVNLLVKILIAIALGIGAGFVLPMWTARAFATFNSLFSEFLGLCVPLIIIGFVAPAITELGNGAGKMLVFTVLLAYCSTVGAGVFSYAAADHFFPSMVPQTVGYISDMSAQTGVDPYFTLSIEAPISVMTALVLAFIVGICGAQLKTPTLNRLMDDFRSVVALVISKAIIPLLPLYIFGIFMGMTISGSVGTILSTFAKIIVVIFAVHVLVLLIQFTIAAFFSRGSRNPLKLLWTMMPSYFTALGTSSSAATIPVTLRQTEKLGVDPNVAGFTVPLCATIHMSGSTLKIVACALAMMLLHHQSYDLPMFLGFICMLAVTMVAAPGVPGGAIMASLGLLSSMLGFTEQECALMIALHISMDSFGTACNVTGDGALTIIINRFFGRKEIPTEDEEAADLLTEAFE